MHCLDENELLSTDLFKYIPKTEMENTLLWQVKYK